MNELERMRHSAAHVMAEAVTSIFPTARLAIGPPIEHGFYYDFELPRALTPDDLKTIEKKMKKIVSSNASFEFSEMSVEDALEYYRDRDQPYKVELIKDLAAAGEENVSFYTQNAFTDLCRGPHVGTTSKVGPFKLLNLAGAYWRGDEHRPMLQRIYGTAWSTSDELATHMHRMEEAQRRDHRRLGASSIYSASTTTRPAPASFFGTQKEAAFATRSRTFGEARTTTPAMTSCIRRT